jgi:serine/threonine protein kinase/tetratricopeptide (TPR) repeat protein
MDTALWQQIREIFHAALELRDEQRERYLNEACPDAAMRREVESLLKSHQDAGDLLEMPALKLASDAPKAEDEDPWIGNFIGAYQVIAKIGQGGMGTVYRAIRVDDQYFKQVAIKVVRSELGTDHHLRRFKNERQIMASLDHPNIARLLDGGTAKGAPYFVMEFIEGKRIDEYCDSRKLSTDARIKLFLDVCSAVQYAHQNLIVHRDLKPGNILITPDGVPKLLDFGIAKLLEPEMFLQSGGLTMSEMKPMTPEFASPEQFLGNPVTTVSDVYSLGVLLYRLLTGHSPYKVEGRPLHELARAISETEPVRPSLAIDRTSEETGADGQLVTITPEAVSRSRDTHPENLRNRLSGDLDNILLKALRKEPTRRYPSVEQFADDLRRHLDGLPVLARKDTIRYRTTKFVMRHRVGVAATLIVALSLVGGIVTSLWQAHIARTERAKAEQRFNDIRRLANSLIFDMDSAIADLPGATAARKMLVSNAVQYLDLLAKDSKGNADLERELATAYRKLFDVQGNQFRGNLGDTAGAMASLRKLVSLRENLAAANPQNHADQVALVDSYRMLAQMLVTNGDLKGGIQYGLKAQGIIIEEAKTHPSDVETLDKLEDIYELMGDIQGGNGLSANLGDTPGALENHRKALEIANRVLELKPGDPAARRSMAIYHLKIGDDLTKLGDRKQSLEEYAKALDIYKAISAGVLSAVYSREMSLLYTRIGDTQLMDGNSAEALKSYRAAMDLAEDLAKVDPQNALAREDLAIGYAMLGKASADSGRVQEGLGLLRKAAGMIEQEIHPDFQNSDKQRVLGLLYIWHAQVLLNTPGSTESALSEYKKTVAIYERIQSAEPNDIEARITLAATNIKIAETLAAKHPATAIALYEKAIPVLEPYALGTPPNSPAQYALGDALTGMGVALQTQARQKGATPERQLEHWTQARSWFERSLAQWKQVNNPGKLSPIGFDTGGPALAAKQLAECDAQVAKLKSLSGPASPSPGPDSAAGR